MTKENMTVRDAINLISYVDFAFEFGSVECNNDCDLLDNAYSLVDDYNTLVTLIKERFGGAVGRVNFKTLENYNADEVNQMIDNLLAEELVA